MDLDIFSQSPDGCDRWGFFYLQKAENEVDSAAGARLYLAPHVGEKTKTKGAGYNPAPASVIDLLEISFKLR